MARFDRTLLALLAVLGLLTALAWAGTALACPTHAVLAQPAMHIHGDRCRDTRMPAKPRSISHDGQICATLCWFVLAPQVEMKAHFPVSFAPFLVRLHALSGFDPGLDPPPPRTA